MTLLFEHVTCSRCGGTGNYSYCQMYGTTCFKCAGRKAVLTTRGAAAQAWLNEKRKARADEFKVGETFLMEGVPGFSKNEWVTLTEIEVKENGTLDFTGTTAAGGTTGFNGLTPEYKLRRRMTNAEAAALKTEALAYQATLTKAGTVRKRAIKK